MNERLTPGEAKAKIRECLELGNVLFRAHAVQRMVQRQITAVQVEAVLRAGVVREAELENGEWRHTVSSQKIAVVVALHANVAVVTVMRTGRR